MTPKTGDIVLFYINRCACVGGGRTEMEGKVIGFTGDWVQVNTYNGVAYVKHNQILRIQG